MLETASFGVAS